jgi:hypothetical protein
VGICSPRVSLVSESGEPHPDEVIITVPADMQAGVWANWGAINESDHEFTIDFARVDHSVEPNVGVVVGRIGMSPRMLRQLLDRMNEAWASFADSLAEDLLPVDAADSGDADSERDTGPDDGA